MAENHIYGQGTGQNCKKQLILQRGHHGYGITVTAFWRPLADHTFNLVIDEGGLDCVIFSSDQIKRRMNMYRDEVGRFLRLKLEDEGGDNNIGGGGGGTTTDRTISRPSNAASPPFPNPDGRTTAGGHQRIGVVKQNL